MDPMGMKISSEAKVNFIRSFFFGVCEIFDKFLQGLGPLLLCWEFDNVWHITIRGA